MKIYSVLYKNFHPLDKWYPKLGNKLLATDRDLDAIEAPGILILHGGSDIHPSLYNRPNQGSHVGGSPSPRDQFEAKALAKAADKGLFIFAICRGAQLACAAVGGILVQHVDNHAGGNHRITTVEGESFLVTSAHHQMMYPWKVEHKLLAWASYPRSDVHVGVTPDELEAWPKQKYDGDGPTTGPDFVEPEVVMFPQINCLAIQGHPEWMGWDTPANLYFKRHVDPYALRA
jgi:hypothetical protein